MKELIRQVEVIAAEELERSMGKFPLFNSPHEGYAVIAEERDELKDEIVGSDKMDASLEWLWTCVKRNSKYTGDAVKQLRAAALNAAAEAIQVVAMCDKWDKSFPREVQKE